MVTADFLLSPEAQLRKQDPAIWGDPTVLAMDKLDAADRDKFAALPLGVATLSPAELGRALPEPHPSWMTRLEAGVAPPLRQMTAAAATSAARRRRRRDA